MSKEYWGTYAVNDHCAKGAFVADLMLYDRLVVPFPPNDKEVARWEDKKWQPKRLEHLLKIIGDDRVKIVPWSLELQERWRERYEAAKAVQAATPGTAFQATRTQLTLGLPAHVTAVEALSAYKSIDDLTRDVGIRDADDNVKLPPGAVTAILGHEFFAPEDPRRTEEEVLREAVNLSSDREIRRKRTNLWRWQFDFVNPRTSLTDPAAVHAALEEMRDLVAEEHAAIRRAQILTASRYAFLVGTVTVGMFTGGMLPVTLTAMSAFAAESFLSVGQFVAERLLEQQEEQDPRRPGAMLADIQRHFRWTPKA
jgi:hypothetical protein